MTKSTFVNLYSDAIQLHEGWLDGSLSVLNLNPGNLDFDHQAGAIDSGDEHDFAKFQTYYAGRNALVTDLMDKVAAGLTSIQSIIEKYSPPSENNTQVYMNAIVAFFSWRGYKITATQPYADVPAKAEIVITINSLFKPSDWHAIQQAISQCGAYMPQYAFLSSYTDADLSKSIVQIDDPLISVTTSVIAFNETSSVIAPVLDGQTMAVLLYDGAVMQGHPSPAGGCEYQQQPTLEPVLAISSVMYNGPTFIDPIARVLFHELIHALFTLTKQPDVLHEYLIAHHGYAANADEDLLAVFDSSDLNNSGAIIDLQTEQKVA